MKQYLEAFNTKEEASELIERVRSHKGTYNLIEDNGMYYVAYHYPKGIRRTGLKVQPTTGKGDPNNYVFDIIGTDGLSIRKLKKLLQPEPELFQTELEAVKYYWIWKQQFKRKTYESGYGDRVPYKKLDSKFTIVRIHKRKINKWKSALWWNEKCVDEHKIFTTRYE